MLILILVSSPIRRMSWSHSLWTITIMLLTIFSNWDTQFFKAGVHCLPLPGKVIKLVFFLYFTQSSVFEIWFVTGVQISWTFGNTAGPQHGTNTGMTQRCPLCPLFRCPEDFSATPSLREQRIRVIPSEIRSLLGILAGKAEPQLWSAHHSSIWNSEME